MLWRMRSINLVRLLVLVGRRRERHRVSMLSDLGVLRGRGLSLDGRSILLEDVSLERVTVESKHIASRHHAAPALPAQATVIGSHHESVPVEGAVIATVAQRRDAGASTARCDHRALD